MYHHIFDFVGPDLDIMHREEALIHPDRAEFIKSSEKEFQDQIDW